MSSLGKTWRKEWNRKLLRQVIHARSVLNLVTECWNWTGRKSKEGYGAIRVGGVHVLAHKVSYFAFKGTRTTGRKVYICHTCDNPACVNPDHLVKRSPKWNAKDAQRKGRRKRMGDTMVCPHGHQKVWTIHGRTTCNVCSMLRERERRKLGLVKPRTM